MTVQRMHADEVLTDVGLVHRLVAGQFPQWADLDIRRVASSGTDNALYRLGDDLVVRLPRIGWAVDQVDAEQHWLPRLAPHLPVAIPAPLVKGEPADGYPWRWSIYRWLDGVNPVAGELAKPRELAVDIAGFVSAMRRIDPTGGPDTRRGMHDRDGGVRGAIAQIRTIEELRNLFDLSAVAAAWDAALQTKPWSGSPVWVHADLGPGNVLVRDGRLSAVIDFGTAGVGDPAHDLIVAWNVLPADARGVFKAALEVDDAAWARGRGLALSQALIALPYYYRTNPAFAASARYVIAEVIADPRP
jgi:aminoglycoside phosphotransferase (APT) family kinase protein